MPGLPDSLVDVLVSEALGCARRQTPAVAATARIVRVAQRNETAVRLARMRISGRALRGDEPQLCRLAVGCLDDALAVMADEAAT